MAKKKRATTKPAPKEAAAGELILPPEVTVVHQQSADSVHASRLITVMGSRARKHMQEQVDGCEERERALRAENHEHREEATKLLQAHADEQCEAMKEAATALVKALKVRRVNFTVCPSMPGYDNKGKPFKEYQLSFSCHEQNDRRCQGDFSFSRTYRFKLPADVRVEMVEAHRTHEEAEAESAAALEWKRRLARIPLYERDLRAQIDENELLATEKGRRDLEAMDGAMASELLCLPAK